MISRTHNTPDVYLNNSFLTGGGEMSKVVYAKNWAETPLGAIETWSPSLRTAVSIVLNSNFPIALAWGEHHIQIYNDGYWPITGDKHPDAIGQDFSECWASAFPVIGDAFRSALAGKTAYLEDQRMFLDRLGYLEETCFTFSFSPIRDENGAIAGLFHPVTETTAKMLAQRRSKMLRDLTAIGLDAQSLHEAFDRLARNLTEAALDVPFALIYQLDNERVNARLVAFTGLEPDENVCPSVINLNNTSGVWPLKLVTDSGKAELIEDLCSRFPNLVCGPYPEPLKQAKLLPIAPFGTGQVSILMVVGMSARLPITEDYHAFHDLLASTIGNVIASAQAVEEERQHIEALAELDRAKTTFFSNISHEFRTPLTLMLGPLEDELAESVAPLPEPRRERLAAAHRNSLRLLKLVNSLLDFSQIESGRIKAYFQPTDLAKHTTDLTGIFRSAIENAGLTFIVNCTALPEQVYVDREMWEKIVLNLLSNAFKHTFEGEIRLDLNWKPDCIELLVKDTGIGIAQEELPHLFERFHRVKGSRCRTVEGTGIGLALVYELAHLHGGEVHVESEPGKGSTFIVSVRTGTSHLPSDHLVQSTVINSQKTSANSFANEAMQWIKDKKPIQTTTTFVTNYSGTERPTIVWADDNPDMRDYVSHLLAENYDVTAVSNGAEALAISRTILPDLVLTDIMMPELDGFGLLRELRRDQHTRHIPVILLSARAGEEAAVEGLDMGADDYLVKPFTTSELLARVRSHLNLVKMRHKWIVEQEKITTLERIQSENLENLEIANQSRLALLGILEDQQHAEEELVKSRNQLAKIFETSPGIVCTSMLRPDGTVCFPYGGERLAEYFGIPTAHLELDATPYFALIHPDDLKALLFSIEESARILAPWRYEWRMIHPIKGLMWIEGHSMPVREQDGSTFWHGVATDITDRKRAEEKIRELNERISTATRASQVGIWDWDVKNNQLTWDDQMYALYGLKKENFTGAYEAWVNGLHPDDREFSQNETSLAIQGEKEYDTEFRVVWPDGTIHFERAKGEVFRNEHGDPVRMVGINYDITEQKRKDQKIREKDQEFRKLSANVPDLIYQFTRKPDGTYCVPIASEGIWNIYGCLPGDVIDDFDPIARVIYPEDLKRVISEVEYSAEHLSDFNCEYRVQIPGREIQWLYSKSTPEKMSDGSVTWYGFNTNITPRKLADEALKINEEQYRNIFESAVIGIYRTTPDGKIVLANPTLIKMLEFDSFEELTQRNLEKEGFENDAQRIKFHEEIEKSGSVIALESVWKTKSGQLVFVSENAKAFYDNSGKILYYEGTIEDITKRKQIEKTLQESEEKFRKAFSTNPDAITITRLKDGRYASANMGFTQIFGYTEDETIGKTSLEINMWHNPEERKEFVTTLNTKGVVENFETKLCTKQGEIKDALVSATIIQLEDDSFILSTTKDITERKHIEEALRESEEKFRRLLESTPLPICYADKEGLITFRNNRFVSEFGYSAAEIPSLSQWWIKAHPDEAYRNWVIQNWESALARASLTNSDVESEVYQVTCKNGNVREIIISGTTINDNFLAIFVDITERKKAEDEVRKLNETLELRVEERTNQLQAANRELEAFSYSVSHDLRAPLRHINGYIDLMNNRYRDDIPEKAQHYLENVSEAAKQMGILIDDLLQFSRTGRQEMRKAKFDMNSLVKEVFAKIKPDIENRKIIWTVPQMPEVYGDYSLLKQVWVNLLDNAVKYTRFKESAEIVIEIKEDQINFVFSVRDNGVGFDMKYAHKLFGVFQRLHSHNEFEGTGIGLANVQRIVHKHNGQVWSEAEPGKGATFFFSLPKQAIHNHV